MKVGIIGAGHIATVHGPIIAARESTEIVGLADKDLSRAKTTSALLNGCQVYQDAEALIEEQKPDVVHILTPPQYHANLSIVAMRQGCHVLVEKPMALNINDAEKMIAVAKQNNVRLCVNHNMVFENVVQRTIELASTGIIGKIVSAEVSYQFDARRYQAILEEGAKYCHWTYQMNGGPLQDLMPHPASLVFEFIPDIKEIQFIGKNRGVLPKGWQDEIRVLINSSSVIGYISISLCEKPDIILFSVKGTKGTIQANLFNDILTVQRRSIFPRAIDRGLSGIQIAGQNLRGFCANIHKFLTGRMDKSNGVAPLITKFYESIRNEDEPPISFDKSLRVVDLMTRIWPFPAVGRQEKIHQYIAKTKLSEPTALVTGGSGFIGTHLIRKLRSENVTVRALVQPNSMHVGRLKKIDAEIFEGSLSNPEALYEATKGIKTIYHAGSPMGNDWEEYKEVAVKGTEHLINAALTHKVERFVQFSSLAVYELLKIKAKNIKEDSPYQQKPKLMGPYAWAKIEIEKRVFEAFHREGLPVTIIRPGMVIGPLGRVFFPHLGYNLQERVFLFIGKGNNLLPLTYVENTVDGIYLAGTVDKAIGQAYNLVDDGHITVRKYIEEFTKIAGNSRKIIQLPYAVPYSATLAYEIAASLGLIKKGVTSRPQLKWKQAKVTFDNTKVKRELGWEPKISIEEGLTKTFQWYVSKY
jgi:nucleoside-diphosphate-sugar epimerase/predicted dehydrogenase